MIEFDGHRHYTQESTCKKDDIFGASVRPTMLDASEYFLVRIPYWLQLSEPVTDYFFGIKKDLSDNFPNGFISKFCYTPDCYCKSGNERFLEELRILKREVPGVYQEVVNSLKEKDRSGYLYSSETRLEVYGEDDEEEPIPSVTDEMLIAVFDNYKKLHGKHAKEEFASNLQVFLNLTYHSYISGTGDTREESWGKWCSYLKNSTEAHRYFNAMDKWHAYT